MIQSTTKEFEEYIQAFNEKILSTTHPLKLKIPKKEFVPLIEKKLKENINYVLFSNLMDILINIKQEISDKTIKELFKDAMVPTPNKNHLARMGPLCSYIITFNKKGYCNLLKRALKEYDTTYALTLPILGAINELKCLNCYNQVKIISDYKHCNHAGIPPYAKEVLKKLDKIKKQKNETK